MSEPVCWIPGCSGCAVAHRLLGPYPLDEVAVLSGRLSDAGDTFVPVCAAHNELSPEDFLLAVESVE